MPRVALIEFRHIDAGSLANELRSRGYHVAVHRAARERAHALRDFDIVVVDLTPDTDDLWALLKAFCRVDPSATGPSVLALCSIYRGPEPRQRAEAMGGDWLYVDE